ncbi:NADH-dependent flavin oxidoreductase [Paenibacillus rhizovicinus]|uniref:NADH-dependent flavin oxidoreductase n=1 Tax=Paenibacillus rhizovicinus TaxID=2704463 RepID=A0A6C0NT71_9BACL|nr:NADH-dependent flavin oxidoreductase [Paenibacillus rhizovicinus]QHW29384.1 NADH-dependent flavin oxidoreductase [Paenibacillus rhizovicinus]
MNPKYKPLFENFTLRSGIRLDNRIVMAPMTNWSSNEDGTVSDTEVDYYIRRAGGVGIVVTACTYVTRNGKGFAGEFGADTDDMIPGLRRLASAIKEKGAVALLQIFHGGRLCPPELVPGGDIVSASDVPSEQNANVRPRPLQDDEIEAIVRDFGETTRRAIEAGFDGVEIHGANGYLLQQFFSPHTNRRVDRWGGDLTKRLTFPLAVVDEVKRVVAEHANRPFAVGYRFSPEEPEENGITMDDTLKLVDVLAGLELDYLHVSLMDFSSKPRVGADESKSRLQWIVDTAGGRTPVIGVGSVHTPEEALEALLTGAALVALGRELIMEPDWVAKVAEGREAEIATTLSKHDQRRLIIPDPLWRCIMGAPGWFPVVD